MKRERKPHVCQGGDDHPNLIIEGVQLCDCGNVVLVLRCPEYRGEYGYTQGGWRKAVLLQAKELGYEA